MWLFVCSWFVLFVVSLIVCLFLACLCFASLFLCLVSLVLVCACLSGFGMWLFVCLQDYSKSGMAQEEPVQFCHGSGPKADPGLNLND